MLPLQDTYSFIKKNFYNVVLRGEYRNKTRNKKWDALLKGEFYATGFNAADYGAYATLTRFLNPKLGNVQVSFQNVNRSPSYIFDGFSSFNLDSSSLTINENTTLIFFMVANQIFTIIVRNISITYLLILKIIIKQINSTYGKYSVYCVNKK
jgi:hypothetical protein